MPPGESRSFESVNYLLRASKQVERKLFIETVHRLGEAGYHAPKYTYLGMGSVYFADFILFHKYLYIDKMICAEAGPIPRRMRFNLPFGFVKLHLEPVGNLVPKLKRKQRYLVWLDYDYELDRTILEDVAGFVGALAPGSIIVVTVNAHSRVTQLDLTLEPEARIDGILRRVRRELGDYVREEIAKSTITKKNLPVLYAEVLRQQLLQETSRRPNLRFIELFNFRYSDGMQMLTIGGMLDSAEAEDRIRDVGIFDLDFIRPGGAPMEISVPALTTRERAWLDKHLGKKDANKVAFEITQNHLDNFREFYRHYPNFLESLI